MQRPRLVYGQRSDSAVLSVDSAQRLVLFLESTHGGLNVVRLLYEGLRIPLAARRRKKVPTVDVDGSRDLIERVRHGMDDRRPERNRFFCAEILGSVPLETALRAAAKKNVLFAASIDADDGPHAMIVGLEHH